MAVPQNSNRLRTRRVAASSIPLRKLVSHRVECTVEGPALPRAQRMVCSFPQATRMSPLVWSTTWTMAAAEVQLHASQCSSHRKLQIRRPTLDRVKAVSFCSLQGQLQVPQHFKLTLQDKLQRANTNRLEPILKR